MRILLADDQPRVRFALRALLDRQPGMEVVGEAMDGEGLLAQAKEACPDLVLFDWGLTRLAGIDLVSALREVCPNIVAVVISGRLRARQAALAAGADAFVSKADPPERLLAAIRGAKPTTSVSEPRREVEKQYLLASGGHHTGPIR
jgi:DNA-binding NarL/FixJ family response regulator